MKFGVRKPNLKTSFKARTTGRVKRTMKRTINPLYGKKGMGWVNNPRKALYNKVYRKTTISAFSLLTFPILLFNLLWNMMVFMIQLSFYLVWLSVKITFKIGITIFYFIIATIENISGKQIIDDAEIVNSESAQQ